MKSLPLVLVVLAWFCGVAGADGAPRLVPDAGQVQAELWFTANLSKDQVFEPFSLAPDIFYGITEKLSIGVIHSSVATTGFYGNAPGNSLCLAGGSNGCAVGVINPMGPPGANSYVYKNGGLEARYLLYDGGGIAVYGKLAALIMGTDPFQIGANVGVHARFEFASRGFVDLALNSPTGFNKRDATIPPTKGDINIPIGVGYYVLPQWMVLLQTGAVLPPGDLADAHQVPVSLASAYWVTGQLGFSFAFTLPFVVAGDKIGIDGVDGRTASLAVLFRS